MRILIGLVVAVMFGCAAPWEDPSQVGIVQASVTPSDDPDAWPRCPDRPDCTTGNGTGVYFQEDGLAAMDPYDLMILRFINTGSGVDVVARYHQQDTGFWEYTRGHVEGVSTPAGLVAVGAMGASTTIPTWKVAAPSPPGGFFDLTDQNLIGLRLALSFPLDGNTRLRYLFWLNARSVETIPPRGPGGTPTTLYEYPAMYQPVTGPTWALPTMGPPPKQYCVDALGQRDPVVFQEGIDVDPVNGKVTRAFSAGHSVTMSCRKGAIATVFSWGYPYLGTPADTFYFDAGIHMKRASYCANREAYTENGVKIWILDDRGINIGGAGPIEARWSPAGATCLSTLRRPLIAAAHGFTHSCPGRTPPDLPPCLPVVFPLPTPTLIDGTPP